MARNVVIVDGMRTPFGRMGGSLKDMAPTAMAGLAIKGLLSKTGIAERGFVDSVLAGAACHDINSYSPARYAALLAGLPYETSASFVEMQCGSAIDSINHAAWQILAGAADVIIAGGMESYSQMFVKFSMATPPYQLTPPLPTLQHVAPVPADDLNMLQISDLMAKTWGIPREACDEYAVRSQQLAAKALAAGYCKDEIVPVEIFVDRKSPPRIFDTDEQPRPETTLEGLAKLKPVNGGDNVTTAGNSSGRNDGAAFVLMMTEEKAKELGYAPYARWVAGADVGVDPKVMGIGPAISNLKALKLAGLKVSQMDVMECNEAFAAQNLSVIKEMEKQSGEKIDMSRWNPNGGAIAFGHPNGASGARICIFAMKELARRGGKYGLFSSCCGGGMGVTTVLENLR